MTNRVDRANLGLSRFCFAPSATYRVAKEKAYSIATERGVSRSSGARGFDLRAAEQAGDRQLWDWLLEAEPLQSKV